MAAIIRTDAEVTAAAQRLGVTLDISLDQLKSHGRTLMKQVHPDAHPHLRGDADGYALQNAKFRVLQADLKLVGGYVRNRPWQPWIAPELGRTLDVRA